MLAPQRKTRTRADNIQCLTSDQGHQSYMAWLGALARNHLGLDLAVSRVDLNPPHGTRLVQLDSQTVTFWGEMLQLIEILFDGLAKQRYGIGIGWPHSRETLPTGWTDGKAKPLIAIPCVVGNAAGLSPDPDRSLPGKPFTA